MAFSNVALFGGAFLTPVIVGIMTQSLGWQWSFYFVAIFTAVALPFMIFFVPETAFRRADSLNTDFTGDDCTSSHEHRASQANTFNSNPSMRNGEKARLNDESQIGKSDEEKCPSTPNPSDMGPSTQYSYWKTLRLFNGRKTDENFLKLFLRPFPLFLNPGILWVYNIFHDGASM